MSKTTAVEWLIHQLTEVDVDLRSEDEAEKLLFEWFDQAKKLEREQIEDAFKHGKLPHFIEDLTSAEYYEQTYGGNNNGK